MQVELRESYNSCDCVCIILELWWSYLQRSCNDELQLRPNEWMNEYCFFLLYTLIEGT